MISVEELLQQLVERGGSDLHVTAGAPPKIRIDGKLIDTEHAVLDPETTQKLIYSILDNTQIARFEKDLELDMSFGIGGLGRFRTNVFMQRGAVGAVLRVIPYEIKGFRDLGLPEDLCAQICATPKGLVLVTGSTGSGKSTTLAAMVDHVNRHRSEHIVTIEDPIEFVHKNKSCLVNQREVGSDTHGFKEALRSVLRQDPDVVLVGEMRDMETIEAALTLAETGHLTFGTLHTSDCVQTMNRIVDVFPAYQQQQIRTVLSFVVQAVFCQQLLPRKDGRGRVMAAEIMIANSAVKSLIREDKAHQIYSIIQTGGKYGMRTMNQSLFNLVQKHLVDYEDAKERSTDVEDFQRTFQSAGVNRGGITPRTGPGASKAGPRPGGGAARRR
ncbi:MAG: type IV pilus twitching motility protein PilT [Planctomycetes bacterium]|nr:type IV pilus twitching motility protein PilT [Planctomycetota bacterium]